MTVTGWDNGLSQDYDRKLGTWFADRLGAREQLRRDFPMTNKLPPLPEASGYIDYPVDDQGYTETQMQSGA
jgi:hypothetical protein